MLKRFLAASAIATGIVGLLAGGDAFADLPEINSGSYTPGQTIYAVATNSKICINKNGGYDGDLIIADIWGTNFRKQITFDSFSGDESCKLVGGAPSDGRMRFVTPMGLSNMSFFTQVEDGYVDGEIYLNLNDATTSNKYVRSYGNTTTRTAKSVATITLDANGGTGALPVIAGATIGSSVTLPKSTLVRDGYRFAGWNTKADGTGTPYADEATITVEEPGQIQLFAQWIVATTTLDTGRKVNEAIKTLAAGSSVSYDSNDTLIKKLEFVDTLPAAVNDNTPKVNIALSGEEPVYAYWVADEGKIYINTEADTIYANRDSSYMFRRMLALTSLTLPASFNTANVTKMSFMFYGMQALTSLNLPTSFDTANVTNMRSMFADMRALTSLNLPTSFDTANVTDMNSMFAGMQALTSLTLPASFDTANVTDMNSMFAGMQALTSLTLPTSFDTANVTDMSYMFYNMQALTSLNLPTSFNTANVTDMSHMFRDIWALTSLTLPASFNTAKVTNMCAMFYNMYALTSLTLPTTSFNTANVMNTSYMFYGVKALTSLTLPASFNTANVAFMNSMFNGMEALTSLTLPTSFDTASVSNMEGMFRNMSALTELDLPNSFVINNRTTTRDIFLNIRSTATLCSADSTARSLWPGVLCSVRIETGSNVNQALKSLEVRPEDDEHGHYEDGESIQSIQFVDKLPDSIDAATARKVNIALEGEAPLYAYADDAGQNVYVHMDRRIVIVNQDASNMFSWFFGLTRLDLSDSFDTSNVTNMSRMFYYTNSLTSLALPHSFNTSNVTDMNHMFSWMQSLTSLTFSDTFNTSNVTDMNSMFYVVESLTSLTLPDTFNTSNVTDMSYMFCAMRALTSITFSSTFYTSNVTNMLWMFRGVQSLTSLTLPNTFDTSSVRNFISMFNQMFALTSLTLPDAFIISNNGAATSEIFQSIQESAVLYATNSRVRSLWPGVLGN